MPQILIDLLIVAGTIGLFFIFLKVYQKWPNPLLLPLIPCTALTAFILVGFNIPYEEYMKGASWLQQLLGPAIVALAVPLFNQRKLIFKYKISILVSVVSAMLAGLVSVTLLLMLFKVPTSFLLSAIPKSLTTPVAMEVSQTVHGIPALTAVLVMIAGLTGAIIGPHLFKWLKIDSAISRGVAMGSASHGVGISKLKDYGEQTLSVGSLAMGLSSVVGAFMCPIFVYLFL